MGGATGGTEEIEVVVLRGEEDDEGGPGPLRRGPAGRRFLQAVAAVLVVVCVQLGPVVVDQPVERVAAPRARPVDRGDCPDPAGRRLWCSFIDDPGCCQVTGADVATGVQPARSRAG